MSGRLVEARRAVGAFIVDGFFRTGSRAAKLHPLANPARHSVRVTRDVPYLPSGKEEHLADIYVPTNEKGPLPTVLYVHGGGFRILSKDSHWIMGLLYARAGYLVVSINYRLAPKHPYPAALEDCAAAYEWVVKNARSFGGDPNRIFLAGESAGANLVTAMSVAASYERPEPFAKRIFATGVVPVATLPACGLLQATDTARFGRRRRLPSWLLDRLIEVESAYLPDSPFLAGGSAANERELTRYDMADPLVVIERGERPVRPLPAFFIACGTRDPLLDDSRRLAKALQAIGVKNELRIYPGGPHAFHALVFWQLARDHWRDNFAFLDKLRDEAVVRASA